MSIMDRHLSPTISVITITLNAERYLEQALASVATQSYPALEHIVVDGGSTDRTLEIVKDHAGQIRKWVSERDKGISDAFNKGIRMAEGDIIGILNADDYYHPSSLEAVSRAGSEYPEFDVYYGDDIHESFDGGPSFRFQPARDFERLIWKRMPISHPSTFIRRAAYERFGLYDLRYRFSMDYELILRMHVDGARFYYIPQILTHFRFGRHLGSGFRENRRLQIENGLHPIIAWLRYLETVGRSKIRNLIGLK